MAKKSKKAKKVAKAAKRKPARGAARSMRPRPAAKRKAAAKRAPARAVRAATPRVDPLHALAKRIVDLTLAGDDEGTYALYADNVESVEMGMPPGVGLAALRQKFAMWRSMVSDATWRPRTVVADGKTIVVEWEGTVTMAANGQQVSMKEVAIHEIENGKIVRERFYYDPTVLQNAAAS